MIVASTAAQPPSQPTYGPKALVVQVNEVPQSGTTRLNSRYAYAAKNIGRNPAMITTGSFSPTSTARMPSVAVSAYAGATEEMLRIVLPIRPTEFSLSPLCSGWVSRGASSTSALESVVLHHVLDPGVVLHAVQRQILAVAGVLVAAVGHLRLQGDVAVDPDAAEVQPR